MSLSNWLNSGILQQCHTYDGGAWLASYIDPAHGNCQTIPDEDNTPSICLQSNFNITIDKDFFVSADYTGAVPSNLDFTVYLTPFPEYPFMVVGWFFYMNSNSPTRSQRAVLIPDQNIMAFISAGDIGVSELRCMYKGCTGHYTGNQYNNEGSMVAASVVIASEEVAENTSGAESSIVKLWKTSSLPVGPDNISNSSQTPATYALPLGIYMVQKYTGIRSEYSTYDGTKMEDIQGYADASLTWRDVYSYASRFIATESSLAINWSCNLDWVCCSIDNMNAAQSLLFRIYAGYQCHYTYSSGYCVLETHKSFLDMNAITLASQINSGMRSIYPASVNDFGSVWKRVSAFLSSKNVNTLVNAFGDTLGGGWKAAANIYNALFFSFC